MDAFILLDYDTLRIIWWLLLGVLLAAFAVMDGADLGIAMLLPVVTKNDAERRVLFNVIGPVWEGNQVWLILAGGVVFAAWPLLYAMAFSGFYLAMMLLLVALIARPVAIKYRSKMSSITWRNRWDAIWCATGIVAALVFGVAVANIIIGTPFGFDANTLRPVYEGSFFGLFTPFTLLVGVISILMMAFQGAVVLAGKTEGSIASLSKRWAIYTGLLCAVLFVLAGWWVASSIPGYAIENAAAAHGYSNPLAKTVVVEAGGWMSNFSLHPWMWLAPVAGVGGVILALLLLNLRSGVPALFFSSLSVVGVVFTFGFATFPFLMPSSLQPDSSLTIYDASASHFSLWIMLLISCFFLPLIVMYTSWVYRVMRGKVTPKSIDEAPHSY